MSTMRVDMYLLRDGGKPDELACRLTGKAWPANSSIQILCNNQTQCQFMDKLLWQLPDNRFIAHQIAVPNSPAKAPITIATEPPALSKSASNHSVLIELRDTPDIVSDYTGINRILDIVADSDTARANARQRYKAYRRLTTEIHTHELPTKS